jgi:catechol 2,3-dioxygenase
LLPERKYLADMLLNLRDKRNKVHFDGFADHLVSESVYIRDPDFNGIEIYRDRPVTEWNWNGNQIEMATLPLDSKSLLNDSTEGGWTKMPATTSIGHVHLHVKDLAKAMNFYHGILGLNLTTTFPSAAFFAAGKYHHHIAANTWLGNDISPASLLSVGLNHFSIQLSSKGQFEKTLKHVSKYNRESQPSDGTTSIYLRDNDGITLRLYYM